MKWVDGNIGSKLTMKYPSVYLMSRGLKESDAMSMIVLGFMGPSPASCRWSTPSSSTASSRWRWRARSARRHSQPCSHGQTGRQANAEAA